MARHVVRVIFGEHVKPDNIDGMLSSLKACGDVTTEPDGRTFTVELHREAKAEKLRDTLLGWDRWGFVKWEQVS